MKRVLIVDDEPDITLLFSTALEESGGLKVDSFNDPLFKQELPCRVVFILIYCL